MNYPTYPAAVLIVAVLCVLSWGCSTRHPEEVRIPDVAPIIAGAEFSEATVMGSIRDVRTGLAVAVTASIGLPSEAAVKSAAAAVETSLDKVEAAVAAHPASEIKQVIQELLEAIEQLREVIKDRDAQIARLKDAEARFWNRVLIGLGIFCSLGAVANLYLAAQVPLFGPRIAGLLGACAVTCFTLAYLAAWARENPVKTAAIVVSLIVGALALAWGNHVRHKQDAVVQ